MATNSDPYAGDTDETKIQEMSSQDVQDISMASQDLSGGAHPISNAHDIDKPAIFTVEHLNEDASDKVAGDLSGFVSINTPKSVNFAEQFR